MNAAADWFVSRGGVAAPAARIFCFPHAGGSPRAFLGWQDGLGGEAEILAVCRPGREHRAAEPAPSIGALIAGAAAAIAAVTQVDNRPYYLFGHSLGALVAFEVCRLLAGTVTPEHGAAGQVRPAERGAAPRHLVASGCSAPSLLPSARVRRIAQLTGREFAVEIGFFGGLPAEVIADEYMLELLLPGVIADFNMAVGYRYQPGPRLPVPATLVVGRDDPHVKTAQLEPWGGEFVQPPDCRWVDGGHFYFEPRPAAVLDILRSVVQADQHVELI